MPRTATRIRSIATAAATTMLLGAAQAQSFYVGGAVGASKYRLDTAGATAADTTGTGLKLFAGYAFGPHLAAEAAVFDLGRATGSAPVAGVGSVSVSGRARGASLAAVLSAPVGDATLFATAGLAAVQGRVKASTPFGPVTQSERSAQPVIGAGLGYAFSPQLSARAAWERVRVRYAGDLKENTDLFSIGLVWKL